MKKFAIADISTGEVNSSVSPATDDMYADRQIFKDKIFIEIPFDASDMEYIQTKYWKDNQWNTREERPGEYYVWENYSWNLDTNKLAEAIRHERTNLLFSSDWTVMPDSPLTEAKKLEWQTYRQALRDVPQNNLNITHINEVVWPTPPA